MRPLPITSLRDTPFFVLGVSLVRGVPTPVLSLEKLLEGASTPEPARLVSRDGAARFVTVAPDPSARSRRVALLVSEVRGVIRPRPEELEALPPLLSDATKGAVAQLATREQGLVLVLDATSLVPAEQAAQWLERRAET